MLIWIYALLTPLLFALICLSKVFVIPCDNRCAGCELRQIRYILKSKVFFLSILFLDQLQTDNEDQMDGKKNQRMNWFTKKVAYCL